MRIGTEVQLPSQFSLMLDAERNPYLHGSGHVPWVAAVRFERSIGLPGIRKPTTQGSVFDDRNGNGVRDAGEAGMGSSSHVAGGSPPPRGRARSISFALDTHLGGNTHL